MTESAPGGGRIRPPYVDYIDGDLLVRLGDSAAVHRVRVFDAHGVEVAWIDSSGAINGRMVLRTYGNARTDALNTGEAWIQRTGGGDIMWPGMPWMPLTERNYAVEIETADGVKTIPLEPRGATIAAGSHTITDERVVVVDSGAAATVTLPAATGSGQMVAISSVGAGAVTVDGAGSETINGSLTQLVYQYEAMTVCDYASGKWTVL